MIAENLKQILSELPEKVRLVAVSKFHPNEAIEEAYRAGQRVFGESKVQEMTAKYESLPKDIEWHFIGHLQTNKIKYIVPYVALIHGIDSYKLLAEVDKQAVKAGKTVNCLLQLHIAREETKAGLRLQEAEEILKSEVCRNMRNVRIVGVMGVATNTDDEDIIREEFHHLKEIFDDLKRKYFPRKQVLRNYLWGCRGIIRLQWVREVLWSGWEAQFSVKENIGQNKES